MIQQGTLTVLYRQTSFGTFGGGEELEHRDGRGPGENHVHHTTTLTPSVG
jgi:hypothetical protein